MPSYFLENIMSLRKMYKGDKECFASDRQVDAMKKAGWKTEKVAVVKKEEKKTTGIK